MAVHAHKNEFFPCQAISSRKGPPGRPVLRRILAKRPRAKIVRAIYPPLFFWALLRVMGASGGPLVLLQVKKGAFITARRASHKKLKRISNKKMILRERGLSLLILAKLSCACSAASLVLGIPIIANVSFATLDF